MNEMGGCVLLYLPFAEIFFFFIRPFTLLIRSLSVFCSDPYLHTFFPSLAFFSPLFPLASPLKLR